MLDPVQHLDLKIARRNIVYLAEAYFGHEVSSYQGDIFTNLQLYPYILIEAARFHAKTECASIIYPIFRQLNDPNGETEIFYFTNSMSQGKEWIIRLKRAYEHEILSEFKTNDWSKSEIVTSNGTRFIARAVGSSVRGVHPNIVLADDILSDRLNYSMDFVKNWFDRTIMELPPPIDEGGQIVVTGTPMTDNDIYVHIKDKPDFKCFKYPGILNWDTKEVLWPEYWTWDRLMSLRRNIGELAFAREILLQVISEGTMLFPYDVIESAYRPNVDNQYVSYRIHPQGEEGSTYIISCDLAIGEAVDSDYNAFIVWEILDGKYVIRWIFHQKSSNSKKIIGWILELCHKFKPISVIIESNVFQTVVADAIIDRGYPVIKFTTTAKNKTDMGTYARTMLDNQKVIIPRGNNESIDMTAELVSELISFGLVKMPNGSWSLQGVGKHDDLAMSFLLGLEAIRRRKLNEVKVIGSLGDLYSYENPGMYEGGGFGLSYSSTSF